MDFEDKFFANQGVETEKVETPSEEPKQEASAEEQPTPTETVEENVETPTAEDNQPPSEESSLNTENTQSQEQQSQEQEQTPTTSAEEDDVFDIDTIEDLVNFASEQFGLDINAPEENLYANDTVKELNDYVAQGGSIEDYINFKMTDYDSMNELELVYRKMRNDYPSLSDEQIQRKLNKQFMLDEDRYDEDERQDGLLELQIAAQDARKHFKQLQEKYATPFSQTAPQQQETQEPEFSEQELEQFESDMQNSLSQLNTIEIGGVKYEVNDAIKQKVFNSPADISDLFVENDSFNFDKYNQARAILSDLDGFVKTIVEQTRTTTLQDIKNNRNNTTLEPETHKPTNTVDSKKAQESLINAYMGSGKKYTF